MDEGQGMKMLFWGIGAFVVIVLFIAMMPFAVIGQTERGIVLRTGAYSRTMEPGIHFKWPLVERVEEMDVSVQKEEVQAAAASKDLQNVSTTIAVNYKLDETKVSDIYTEVRNEYSARLVAPAIQEAVKAATAKYTAEELITKREQVKAEIFEVLKTRLATRDILIQEVLITNFDFSSQFNTAIEAKVQAEQEALAAKNQLERVKYEAEQRVTQATAEAEAIKIQAQAITQQGGAEYVRLKTIEKWNGAGCTQYCGLETSTGLLIGR